MSRPKNLLASITALILAFPLAAGAQGAPTDADLKSAYCMGALEKSVEMLEKNARQNPEMGSFLHAELKRPKDDLHRLRSYLEPRMPHLDTTGLAAAKGRGAIDYGLSLSQHGVCLSQCKGESNKVKWQQCYSTCTQAEPAVVRSSSCGKMDWLPF